GAEPTPRDHRVDGLPDSGVRPGVELAPLEGAEDDPGRCVVVDAKADVLPRVTAKGRDKLQRESGTIRSNRAGQCTVNYQTATCDRGRTARAPGGREPICWEGGTVKIRLACPDGERWSDDQSCNAACRKQPDNIRSKSFQAHARVSWSQV